MSIDRQGLLRTPAAATDAVEAITLRELLSALDTAVVGVVDAPAGDNVMISSVALVDGSDLSSDAEAYAPVPDLYLHAGVTNAEAIRWFNEVAQRSPEHRPAAVMSKNATESSTLRTAARRAGVALLEVHPKARWDHVLPLVKRMLDRSRRHRAALGEPDLLATDTDLFGLAQMVAQNAGGLVSIEDAQSHVLAYSASNESADNLRTLSILGREGPRDYLRALEQWGVFDRLRESDAVIDVPAHPKLGTERRLVVSIRQPSDEGSPAPGILGSIWLQQGATPFTDDAADVLRGASAIAGRIIWRSLNAPSTEGLLIQRLFGARGGGVDVPSLAGALSLPVTGPAAVVGFALTSTENSAPPDQFASIGSMIRLHASSFRHDSVATIIGKRAYVLLPGYRSASTVAAWARQLVDDFEAKRSVVLRAAVAVQVMDLGQVAGARTEVDRVLDGTAATFPENRVTTLAESRTAVLLGEILDLVGAHPELYDPRLDALFDYDLKHASSLRESAEAYLAQYGDVRAAAAALQVHPNTLRYRLRRVEDITGIDLGDPSDRLLLELQLSLHRRKEVTEPPA
ncbi:MULTISPECIES: PucR family transcriptional regulator [Streptomyces]|uniref:PucR family transcriptional regulator n=1 Tax=Streptomyces TaxID=1883 RepID=UPI00068ADDF4|nr:MULTISPECIES: helix-turn-helix domain-containing protein [Streptomyces]